MTHFNLCDVFPQAIQQVQKKITHDAYCIMEFSPEANKVEFGVKLGKDVVLVWEYACSTNNCNIFWAKKCTVKKKTSKASVKFN